MKIVVDKDSFQQTRLGTISGLIWVEHDRVCFPEKQWSDLIAAVIRGWLEDITKLVSGSKKDAELWFMDGPFQIRVSSLNPNLWLLSLENRRSSTQLLQFESKPSQFVGELLKASSIVVDSCKKKNFVSSDIEHIERRQAQLAGLIS
jgi:hypothetical protein